MCRIRTRVINNQLVIYFMSKKNYESPLTETVETSVERMFLASGEKANIVNGYSWDDDE